MSIEESASEIIDSKLWHQLVEREVEEANKSNTPLSVIFVDVDNLKYINDKYGHPEGDIVIAGLSNALCIIKNNFRIKNAPSNDSRQVDIVAHSPHKIPQQEDVFQQISPINIEPGRIGGDEFAALCHTDKSGVEIIAKRLRLAFHNQIAPNMREDGIDISIGSSTHNQGMSVFELLKIADQNLYEDKKSHLAKLTDEQQIVFRGIIKALTDLGIRPRDYHKYYEQYKV